VNLFPLLLATILATAAAPAPPGPDGPWLGVFLGDSVDGGASVLAVVPGGPAERAGLRAEDVLVAVGETPVAGRQELVAALEGARPGERIMLTLLRDGRRVSLPVRLGRAGEPPALLWTPSPGAGAGIGLEATEIPGELRVHYGAPPGSGVLVARLDPEGPAARAGVKVGDVLVQIAGRPVAAAADVEIRTRMRTAGQPLALDLVRRGQPVRVALPAEPSRRREEAAARAAQIEAEIERLSERIEALTRELESLREKPPGP